MAGDRARVEAAAARCGFRTFNDFSEKFGFAPGYNAFVIGAYPARGDADGIAAVVRKCIPDAYVKFGKYAGE